MAQNTHFRLSPFTLELSTPRRRLRARAAATLAALGATLVAAAAQADSCPVGSYCYYAPPILPMPPSAADGFAEDLVLSSPSGTITGTYAVNGGAPTAFTVASGTPIKLGLAAGEGVAGAFKTAEKRGIEIVADSSGLIVDQRMIAWYWQSSSTVKSNVVGLGTRFRAGGYTLNNAAGDGTGYDFLSFFAPTGATITVTAPPGAAASFWNDGIVGPTNTFSLQAGETYLIRTNTSVDIDGALVTSDQPISVAIGGRGWAPAGCGDDGMDHLVPTNLLGTQYVVDDYPSNSAERVRVVADLDGTEVRVNGTLMATLNAGEHYDPAVTDVTFIETSKPAYVFQNAGYSLCENDVALIPPISFAQSATLNVGFDVIGTGAVNIVLPTATLGSILLDGAALVNPSVVAVPGHAEWSRVRFNVGAGTHTVSANSDFQLGLVSSKGGSDTGLFAYFNPYRVPGCGDGTLDMGEGCDDGNVKDADGCSATCQIEASYECMGEPSVCQVKDTDGDGMSDYAEGLLGYDPNNGDADGDGILDPSDLDLDNDGIPNTVECKTQGFSLVNGSFEEPAVPASTVDYFTEDQVPGWDTTASDNVMEFWGTNFLGVPAADGNQFVELNANEVSTLYQDLTTTPGETYFYRFYHRGRDGDDTLAFYVGDPNGAPTKLRQITTGNAAWQLVTGVYTIPTGQTSSRFSFESVSSAGGGSSGNFLDGIAFTPGCKVDTDGDGTLDFRDMDADGDGLLDGAEAGHGLADMNGTAPGPYGTNGLSNQVETTADSGILGYTVLDTDGDGTPNFQDVDADGDGVNDDIDVFPLDPMEWADVDQDGVGDNGDNCPMVSNPDQADTDGDGIGDACDIIDTDNDGIADGMDNCPMTANADQADADMDGIGDACEADTDMDGVIDDIDNCPMTANTDQADTDMDGTGDACEADADMDGVDDAADNCPNTSNPDQADGDKDGIGDACEADTDMDGVIDDKDNCPEATNPDQLDADLDGTGDVCEPEGVEVVGSCACRQAPTPTGNAGGVMTALGAMLVAMWRRRRKG